MTTPTTQREADERTKLIKRAERIAVNLIQRGLTGDAHDINAIINFVRQAAPEAPASEQHAASSDIWYCCPRCSTTHFQGWQAECMRCNRPMPAPAATTASTPAATDQPSAGQVLPPFEQDVYMVDECMRDCEPDDQRAWKRIRNVAMGDAISQMAQEALARASLTPTAPQAAEEQLRRMRAAFHINMLRAFPGKTHAEIEAEIDKACGTAPQAASPTLPGDWTIEWDRYSPPETIRLNSQKWGGCFLRPPEPHDIGLHALAYRFLADTLSATPQPTPDVCATCGGSKVDPGGLPVCRDCAAPQAADRDVCAEMRALCSYCGGTGDVHSVDGEWRGRCTCPAGAPQAASQQATVKDALRRCGADTDYHGKMLFSVAQFDHFVSMIRPAAPQAATTASASADATLIDEGTSRAQAPSQSAPLEDAIFGVLHDCMGGDINRARLRDAAKKVAALARAPLRAVIRKPFEFDEWLNEHSEGAQLRSGKELRDFERAINEWANSTAPVQAADVARDAGGKND